MAKEIKLTKGQFAIVDDEDFDYLNQFCWVAIEVRRNCYQAYSNIKKNGKRIAILMHRIIMSAPCGMEVDHINRNSLDNRRSNLRLATRAENSRNRKPHSNNKLGLKGVIFCKKTNAFRARITFNKETFQIGYFDSAEAAALAYNQKAKELHGEFAYLNEV